MKATKERIGTAQMTANLGETRNVEDVGDVDVIRACGMAAQSNPLGLSIWRWRVGGDQREIFAVARGLVALGHDAALVATVLGHLADDICRPCGGRGYQLLPGVPVLSDELCGCCRGTGRRPLEEAEARDLLETIARLQGEVAASIMRKLSREMEF